MQTKSNSEQKALKLCDRGGDAEIEWLDSYCQECWEYYTAELWWEMWEFNPLPLSRVRGGA